MNDTAQVTITLDEPVSLTRQARADFRQDTYDHVPGSVLRGALAARWIQERGTPSPESEFADVFEGEGSFGPLYAHDLHPIPLSVAQHKYQPHKTCKQLWWDRALGDDEKEHCADCGQELEHGKGKPKSSPEYLSRTRVALTEEGVAKDGNLFVQNALAPGITLRGWLSGPAVRALYLDAGPVTTLLLGAGRSVRGRAMVQVRTDVIPDPVELNGNDVVLRLASPGVFVDEFGLPSDKPSAAEISEVLGVEATVQKKWTRWTEAGGWHLASGLPKPTERAVERGSTYVVHCAETPTEDARRMLMARGLGLRRREGFGALCRPPARPFGTAPRHLLRHFAHLRGLENLPRRLRQLRAYAKGLRDGTADATTYRNEADAMDPWYGEQLHELLDVTDAETFHGILNYLEHGE